MSKENIEAQLEIIGSKLDYLSGGSYSIPDKQTHYPQSEDIDLRELWKIVWAGKWIIIVTTFFFAIGSIFYALSLPNRYKSSALLSPNSSSKSGGLSAIAGQFSGLASLAGVSLSGGGDNEAAIALEVIKSRQFIRELIQKNDLLVPLIASKGWYPGENKLVIDEEVYSVESGTWVRDVDPPAKPEPSEGEAYNKFRKILDVQLDKKTNFVTISIEHFSPQVAKEWVDLIIAEINEVMRVKEVSEARRNIEYLEKQLEKTSVADMKSVFYQLVEEQHKVIMLAQVKDDYVFSIIDPAYVPEQKSSPQRSLICLLITIIGGVGALVVVFLMHISMRLKREHR